MGAKRKQVELFNSQKDTFFTSIEDQSLAIEKKQLISWQLQINTFQSKLFRNQYKYEKQFELFSSENNSFKYEINPITIPALPMNFWKWPKSYHTGPAIYFVMDRPKELKTPILLYIGETIAADKRWKGDHDCKEYLSSYSECLSKVGLKYKITIRFWSDVPSATKERRSIEQKLIKRWQPPFNKETRERWATPFTT